MEITEVRITLRDEPKLKAFANITFDDDFVIRGLKVIEGKKGLFISMPSRRAKDGTYRDIAHPINNDTREKIEKIILEKYYEELERAKAEGREIGKGDEIDDYEQVEEKEEEKKEE